MTTVAAFSSTGAPGDISGAQNPPTQPFVNTQEAVGGDATARSYSEPARPRAGLTPANTTLLRADDNEALCQQLTGLCVREASVSVGRYLKVHWNSLLEVDSLLRAALLPIRECTPKRLQHCMTVLVRRYPDPRGMHRWVNRLMRQLVPILDWKVVLAYARFSDPAIAEQSLAPAPGSAKTFPAPSS